MISHPGDKPEGATDSRPSNAPPKEYQHTFGEARVYLPEEQKAFALRMSPIVDDKVKRLRTYAEEVKSAEGEVPAIPGNLIRQLRATVENLAEPITEDLLREINFSPTSPGNIGWKDIRQLYGSRRIDAVLPFIDRLEEGLSLDEVERLILVLDKIREDLDIIVEERGGSSEKRLVEIIGRYKVEEDSKWHRVLFNDIELQHYVLALNILSERFGIAPSELVTEDLGCGSGRCFDQLRELFEEGFIGASGFTKSRFFKKAEGYEEVQRMAAHYHGIDKLESNVEKTRALVRAVVQSLDFDETENIKLGDFHMPEDKVHPRIAPGTVHFAFSMMRTGFHNLTEDEFHSFLRTVERDLAPGGIMLMDTVRMRRVEPELREGRDVEAHLDDLKNLYPQIFRANNERYQRLMPGHIRLEDMPRFPIYDNTTGRGFYWREVITQGYIEHIIEKYGLNLEVTMFASHQHNFRDQIKSNPELRRQAAALGKKWIDENELRDYYLEIINDRLKREVISPRLIEKVGYKGDPEVFLDYLGYHMVRGFASSYTFLEKKMDKTA